MQDYQIDAFQKNKKYNFTNNTDNNMQFINQENLYINFKNLQKQIKEKESENKKLIAELNKLKDLESINKIKNLQKKEKELKDKTTKLEELNSLNKTLEEKIKIIEKERQDLTEDLETLQKQKSKMEMEFQNNIKNLKAELNKTRENLELKEKELKDFVSKYGGALSHFGNVDNQIKEKDNQIELLSKYKEENELLKKENNSLRLAINQGETKEEYLLKPAEEFYDVIIDIKSINSLKNEGWKILRNEQRKEAYEKIIGEETMKIGVLGLNNVGKSFLLKKNSYSESSIWI